MSDLQDTIGTNIQQRLTIIQHSLKAPKGQFNSFGKYHYRSCEDIVEALKPLLYEQGVTLTISDTIVLVGTRFYVRATATISLDADSISVTAFAREADDKKGMDESQITGAASSYARKYALNGLFLIDDTKDADTMDNRKEKTAKPKDEPATPSQIEEIEKLLRESNSDRNKFFTFFKVEKPTAATAPAMIETLNKKLGAMIDEAAKANS